MDKELKDTLNKVADYSREDKKRMARRMSVLFFLGILGNIFWAIVEFSDLPKTGFLGAAGFGAGFGFAMLIIGFLMASGIMDKTLGRLKEDSREERLISGHKPQRKGGRAKLPDRFIKILLSEKLFNQVAASSPHALFFIDIGRKNADKAVEQDIRRMKLLIPFNLRGKHPIVFGISFYQFSVSPCSISSPFSSQESDPQILPMPGDA